MSEKVKDNLDKLTIEERERYENNVGASGCLLLLNIAIFPMLIISIIAEVIWDNNITTFLMYSLGFIELFFIALFILIFIGYIKEFSNLKRKIKERQ